VAHCPSLVSHTINSNQGELGPPNVSKTECLCLSGRPAERCELSLAPNLHYYYGFFLIITLITSHPRLQQFLEITAWRKGKSRARITFKIVPRHDQKNLYTAEREVLDPGKEKGEKEAKKSGSRLLPWITSAKKMGLLRYWENGKIRRRLERFRRQWPSGFQISNREEWLLVADYKPFAQGPLAGIRQVAPNLTAPLLQKICGRLGRQANFLATEVVGLPHYGGGPEIGLYGRSQSEAAATPL